MTERKLANNPHQPVGRWITVKRRLAIYLRDGFRCVCCCRDLSGADPFDVTLDHHVPRALGGSNASDNVYTCCRDCNNAHRHSKRTRRTLGRVRAALSRPMTVFLDAATVLLVHRGALC